MSYQEGIALINLQKTDYIPRTEYSAHNHWSLIKEVCKIDAENADNATKQRAASAFVKQWNYSYFWNIMVNKEIFNNKRTSMGHAEYASGGSDFNNNVNCPFKEPADAFALDFFETYGVPNRAEITKKFNENYDKLASLYPDCLNSTGIYVTMMSGLIEILGWEMLLLSAGEEYDDFCKFTDRYAEYILPYFEALAESKAPVFMIHDDIVWSSGPFISLDFYKNHIFKNYKKLFAPLIESGKKILYTSDGDYTMFLDDVAACGVNGFVMEPLTDLKIAAEKFGKTHALIGNVDTRVLLRGKKEEIYAEVKRCMDIGRDCNAFMLAVGNHIPANTPVESCLYYDEVYRSLAKR